MSTAIAHSNPAPSQGAYSASKAGFANLLQHFADEVSAEEVQMINFHPGSIFTSASQRFGMDENTLPWDHGAIILPQMLNVHDCADTPNRRSSRALRSMGIYGCSELLARQIRLGQLGCERADQKEAGDLG